MRLAPYAASPDGKWLCYVEKTGAASGRLVLENAATGRTSVLDPDTPFSYESVPVKWAPDSSVVLYCRDGYVYFTDPEASARGLEMDEPYRKIGQGTIRSVCWAGTSLFYIDSDIVYRIDVKDLFTVGLYSGIIGKGSPSGRLPEHFNPDDDMFSVNGACTSLFLIKSGKVFSQYELRRSSCGFMDIVFSRPYTDASGSLLDAQVLWNAEGGACVWMRIIPYDGGPVKASVCRIGDTFTPVINAENSCRPVVSADGSLAAFCSGSVVYVYSTETWKRVNELPGENLVSAVWGGNTVLYVGGTRSVRRWNVVTGESRTLFLSSAVSGCWDPKSGQVLVKGADGKLFMLDRTKKLWIEQSAASDHPAVSQNGRYRVFCGTTPNALYENALYVRTLSAKAVTKPVYPESAVKVPERRKAALVIDAYDSTDGLPRILSVLNDYGVPGTFCFSGEFIRRYPAETKQIAAGKFRCASLFFADTDLTGKEFIADESFIRRGLARNEDEFYQCTGNELSLMWHAPRYRANDAVKDAGRKAGYAYIDALCGGKGDITLEQAAAGQKGYLSSAQIMNDCLSELEKNGGGCIPVTAGYAHGTRADYVYDYLDLLISAVLDAGYEIVPADGIVQ
jgi:hypothetical protein